MPTVDALAYNLVGHRDMVCPLMDARRNQVYSALYYCGEKLERVSDYMAQTKLAREQTRGKNKEDLLAIIDSDAQTELDKQAAIDAVVRLTDYSDKENAVETLLSAKGFDHSIVSITQDAVDVVICKDNLTDAELAQIEDIVKRKTNIAADKIVITPIVVDESGE